MHRKNIILAEVQQEYLEKEPHKGFNYKCILICKSKKYKLIKYVYYEL